MTSIRQKDKARLDRLTPEMEAILAMGSSIALEPIAGLAGIMGTLWPGPKGQGARTVEKVRGLGYKPKNTHTLDSIANAVQYPMEVYGKAMDTAGDKTMDATGSPLLGSIVAKSPELLGTIAGLGALGPSMLRGAKSSLGKALDKATDGPVDLSRRKLFKDAGTVAAGTALAGSVGKEALSSLLSAGAPVGEAVGAAAKMYTLNPAEMRLATVIQAFPEFNMLKGLKGEKNLSDSFYDSFDELAEDQQHGRGLYADGMPESIHDIGYTYQRLAPHIDDLSKDMADVDVSKVIDMLERFDDGMDSVQLDLSDPRYNGLINPHNIAFGDWVQGGNVNDNIGNASWVIRDNFDSEFGEMYDPVSGDINVINHDLFDEGPTNQFSTRDYEPLRLYDSWSDAMEGIPSSKIGIFEEPSTPSSGIDAPDSGGLNLSTIQQFLEPPPIEKSLWSTTKTGRAKWDELLASDQGTIETMSPDELMRRMAKGQGTTVDKAVKKRMDRGGQEKIDKLVDVLENSPDEMNLPVLDYAEGGFVQDGYHRALAAKQLGLEEIPVGVIRRR